jgi:hypothetical protein
MGRLRRRPWGRVPRPDSGRAPPGTDARRNGPMDAAKRPHKNRGYERAGGSGSCNRLSTRTSL